MARKNKKDAKAKKGKKAKKPVRVEVRALARPFALSPEMTERLAAASAGWQSRAESVLAQWLDQASLTLRRNGVQGLVDDAREAKRQIRGAAERTHFESAAREVASTVARELTQLAMSAALGRATARAARPAPAAPQTASPAASAKRKVPAKPKAAKPAAKPKAAAKPKTAAGRRAAPAKAAAAKKPAPKRRVAASRQGVRAAKKPSASRGAGARKP